MNAPRKVALPDIQSRRDNRELTIDAVGIKGVRYPVTVIDGPDRVATVAGFAMTVELPAEEKGTHMSRFVEVLEARHGRLDPAAFRDLVTTMAGGWMRAARPSKCASRGSIARSRRSRAWQACWIARSPGAAA